MTLFHLARHARHTQQDHILAGRTCDPPLSRVGCGEAHHLAELMIERRPAALYSSPRLRAFETARAIAEAARLAVSIHQAFDEIDFGDWSGARINALSCDARWRKWNDARATARCPGGESIADVLARVLAGLHDLAERHPAETVAVVSHAEPIRTLVLHCAGGSFGDFLEVDIPTASIVSVAWNGGAPRLAERAEAAE